ncbi:hypothetical protein MSG28_012633 [Choristoneura fumiferana]|uniref:Uncharacterized protein n=1 Tax=Choristoneura fumiferana TaxID=7141 RepID=A0ACC0JHE2_CHOFU|nr:hypothetical protein MSG28_012633 [Choristoneura fumiferana]
MSAIWLILALIYLCNAQDGGTEAGIDQYPWLALIEYEREHQIKQLCVGALISGRYVLTAAHCVVGPAMIKNIPKNVRLGEYDTEKATDCVEFEGGDEGDKECTLGPVIIPIEHIITHPDYKVYARNFRNDIALLRLASIPEYTANKTEAGQCVDVLDCDHIRTRLATSPVPQQYKDYVYSLRCEGTAFISVCCGPPPDYESVPTPIPTRAPLPVVPTNGAPTTPVNSTPPESKNSAPTTPENRAPPVTTNGNTTSCTMSAQPSDPASGCCGLDGLGPKIVGGTEAGIDQYPWLALIEYEREHQIKLLCVGALISGRYVLTAAHCVVGPAMIKNIPKNVRLGEYDTEKATDCVEFEGGDEGDKECTLGPVIIPIEHIITHPDYKVYARNFRNDIALLRLASIPEYTGKRQ